MDPAHDHPLAPYRLRVVAFGVQATIAVVFLGMLYAALPGHGELLSIPYAAVLILGLAGGLVVWRLPWRRLIAERKELPVFAAWTLGNILLVTVAVGLNDGARSDIYLVYAITTVFFGAIYPPKGQALLLAVTFAAYLSVLAITGWGIEPAVLVLRLGLIGTLAFVGNFLTRELILQTMSHHQAQQRLEHYAYHDPLTKLANRTSFMDRLELAVSKSRRREGLTAVLFLDLDGFKSVNDTLGHEAGDELLLIVAGRLSGCLRPEDTVARLGGDEFTALLEDIRGARDAVRAADRCLDSLKAPIRIRGRDIYVTASVGIVVTVGGRETPSELLRQADLAMYVAKERGKARWEMFDAATARVVLEQLEMEAELRRAVEKEEVIVHYQPEVSLETGRIIGWEALVRWDHPSRGLLPAAEFIALAEDTGLILAIDRLVLDRACRQVRDWQKVSGPECRVSVNLSPRWLRDPTTTADIERIVDETGLARECVQVEVTERAAVADAQATLSTLHALRSAGIRVALDDFGTAYSSLKYLKQFPLNVLKLDGSLIGGMTNEPQDTAIVQAVTSLGEALGIHVAAEGIESAEQLDSVRELGCRSAQGNHLCPPLDPQRASALLLEDQPLPAHAKAV